MMRSPCWFLRWPWFQLSHSSLSHLAQWAYRTIPGPGPGLVLGLVLGLALGLGLGLALFKVWVYSSSGSIQGLGLF